MPDPRKIPIAIIDKKGQVICPVCSKPVTVPEDSWLAAGMGNCQPDASGHLFAIDEEGMMKANEILAKTNGGKWRKPVNREFGGLPAGAEPPKDEDGKNFLIG